jgi:arylsulfatase A-like enzyme
VVDPSRSPRRALYALLACAALACSGEPRSQPDVVVVTLDTTRADHLGIYGYGRDTSPAIDRFAEDAVVYDRAWATGAWTLPTHASILTGKHVSSHGARFDTTGADVSLSEVLEGEFFERHKARRLPADEVTLAELLSARGYATAAFAAGPWLAPPFGLLQGYGVQDARVSGVGGRPAEEITDRFIEWLMRLPDDVPLHALVNYFDAHSPYDPPPGFDDLPHARDPLDPAQDELYVNGGAELKPAQRRSLIDRYDGEIRYMDHHLGRLLAALRRVGRYRDALIVLVGDHGELFGEHGVLGHGRWLYEGVLRVPLLVHFPGGAGAGRRENAPISQVDLLPLVAAELGLALPAGVEGVAPGRRESLLAQAFRDPFSVSTYGERYDRDLVALVRWPWKLIASDRGAHELYQLAEDPAEARPVVDPVLAAELDGALQRARAALGPEREAPRATGVDAELQDSLRALGYIE